MTGSNACARFARAGAASRQAWTARTSGCSVKITGRLLVWYAHASVKRMDPDGAKRKRSDDRSDVDTASKKVKRAAETRQLFCRDWTSDAELVHRLLACGLT